MTYSDRGIILKRFPYSELDYLVTLLSARHGRFTALAKGVRKVNSRRGGHLELFSHVRLVFHAGRGNLDIIGEVKTLDSFDSLGGDLARIELAFYFCELIDVLLPEREENYSTYRLLLRALDFLAHAEGLHKQLAKPDYAKRVSDKFSRALLNDLGYWPRRAFPDYSVDVKRFIESIIEKRLRTPDLFS